MEPRLRQHLLLFEAARTQAQQMEGWYYVSKLHPYHLKELCPVRWIAATVIYSMPAGFNALAPPDASLVIEDDCMPKDYEHAIVLNSCWWMALWLAPLQSRSTLIQQSSSRQRSTG